MTIEQTNNLSITEYLEEFLEKKHYMLSTEVILPTIRTLELSLIEKAKTDEKNRIVGILFEWMGKDGITLEYKNLIIKEAINLITNQ